MRQSIRFVRHALIVVILTLLTQIGGLAYIAALLVTRRWRRTDVSWWTRAGSAAIATLVIYSIASFVAVPPLAAAIGRVHVPCSSTTFVGCMLNRAYLRPRALALVTELDRRSPTGSPEAE